MAEKLIVNFDALPVLPYESDYLSYCIHCGTYNLGDKPCVKCARTTEISLDEVAARTIRKHFSIRMTLTLLMYVLLFLVSMNFTQLFCATLFSGICTLFNILIYRHFKEFLIRAEMNKHIKANSDRIKSDLKKQMVIATKNVDEGNLVEAYNRFRYLAKLTDTNEVRTYKLICLRNFQLRSDMPLEMNMLLQEEYNSFLIDYIYEISKLKKELIDDATLSYILKHKEQVLMKNRGEKKFGNILVATLRSEFLFCKYASEIPGYLKYFSKERLLRLCKLSKTIDDEVLRRTLLNEVKEIIGEEDAFVSYYEELGEA